MYFLTQTEEGWYQWNKIRNINMCIFIGHHINITVYISLIINKMILFNKYYHYSMIIDAIPSMAEINDYWKIKDCLKKKLKIWSWKGTIKLKYRFDMQQLPSSFEERQHQEEVYKSL